MTDALTYSLRLNKPNSDEYYKRIADLAERWLADARIFVTGIINEYAEYRHSLNMSERSFEELAFEMLALGLSSTSTAHRQLATHTGLPACWMNWWRSKPKCPTLKKRSKL